MNHEMSCYYFYAWQVEQKKHYHFLRFPFLVNPCHNHMKIGQEFFSVYVHLDVRMMSCHFQNPSKKIKEMSNNEGITHRVTAFKIS